MSHRLINSLKRDHVKHRRLLDIFARQIDRVAKVQAPDYDIVEGVIEYFTTYSLRVHHPKEEMLIAAIAARERDAERRRDLARRDAHGAQVVAYRQRHFPGFRGRVVHGVRLRPVTQQLPGVAELTLQPRQHPFHACH